MEADRYNSRKKSRKRKRKKKKKWVPRCHFKLRCRYELECGYYHTQAETNHFRKNFTNKTVRK